MHSKNQKQISDEDGLISLILIQNPHISRNVRNGNPYCIQLYMCCESIENLENRNPDIIRKYTKPI